MLKETALCLILLGAPGAGKGTQAEIISNKYHIPTISTGNIIRESVKSETSLGLQAKAYIAKGDLVPDDIIISIVKERLSESDCENGFILDGMPRTIAQAEALTKMEVPINKVISIEVSDEKIIKRLSGRRVCSKCGSSYHLTDNAPTIENVCNNCESKLIVRSDDDPEIIADRLRIYHEQTEPLKNYYRDKGLLKIVQGQDVLAQTTALVEKALSE